MKVVHIIIGLDIGGAELMLKRLIESSSHQNDIEHIVISLTDIGILGARLSSQNVDIYCLGMFSFNKVITTFFKLRKLLKKIEPDVVQTWMYHADFIGGIAAKSLNIKKVYWNVRNTNLSGRGVGNLIFRKTCALLSHFIPKNIVYVSFSAEAQHIASGYAKSKSVIINNGFDQSFFSYKNSAKSRLRSEWKLSDKDFLVCSIGRYAKAKDHITFIKSIKKANKGSNKIFAVLVGKGIPTSNKLRKEIGDDNEKFVLLHSSDDIPAIMSASDLFCLHSETEGFPNVLGEAMSVGLPCITTRAGDAELILNNKVLTCDVGDYNCIAERIIKVFNMTADERRKLGFINRGRVANNYSLSYVVNKYINLYRS